MICYQNRPPLHNFKAKLYAASGTLVWTAIRAHIVKKVTSRTLLVDGRFLSFVKKPEQ